MKSPPFRPSKSIRLLAAGALVAALLATQTLAQPTPKPMPGGPKPPPPPVPKAVPTAPLPKAPAAAPAPKKATAAPAHKTTPAGKSIKSPVERPSSGKKSAGKSGKPKKSSKAPLDTARRYRWKKPPQSLRAAMRKRGLGRDFYQFSWRSFSRPYGCWLYFDRVTAGWYYFAPQLGYWVPMRYIANFPPPPDTPPPPVAGTPPAPPPGQTPQVPKPQPPAPDEVAAGTGRTPAGLTARAEGAYPGGMNAGAGGAEGMPLPLPS